MKGLGLRTIIYLVPDLTIGKRWYHEAFGIAPYFDESFYVGFNIGGYELGLLPDTPSETKSDNVLSYWGVENIQAAYDELLSKGATSHQAPTSVGGELMVATVKDPWDNVIGIIYNPHFNSNNVLDFPEEILKDQYSK